jgi:hypothetical protein
MGILGMSIGTFYLRSLSNAFLPSKEGLIILNTSSMSLSVTLNGLPDFSFSGNYRLKNPEALSSLIDAIVSIGFC